MTAPHRIAFVITELAVGGAERCLANLATGLDRSQFEPVVYSLGPLPQVERDQLVTQLEMAGVPIHFLNLTHWSQMLAGVRSLARHLRAQQADIVQTFLYHANVLGARAAIKAGVRHVYSGIRVADPRWSRGFIERQATRRVDRIVCVSQGVADQCLQRGFDAKKLVVIPNGIEVQRWKCAQPADLRRFGLPAGRRAILFVGRLDRQKGLDELLQDVPFDRLHSHDLLIVGDGPWRERLEITTEKLGVKGRVHFAGWQADVPSIIAASDVLILASKWEGMPNVVLEAMAAGKPVLIRPIEGAQELLGPTYDDQTATSDVAERLTEIVSNMQLRQHLGTVNQARAEQEFSVSRMVSRYTDMYISTSGSHREDSL